MLPVLIKLCVLNTKYYSLVLSCSKLWVYYISIGMYCNMRCIAQYAYILIHEVVHSFRYQLAKDRRLWLILSNALEKSMISTASWHHFSTASDTSSMNPSNWDSQDLPQQKPRCSGWRIWCSSTYPIWCWLPHAQEAWKVCCWGRWASTFLACIIPLWWNEPKIHSDNYYSHKAWFFILDMMSEQVICWTGCLERDDNNWKYITIQVFHSISMKHFVQQHTSHKSNKDDLFSNVSLLCDHLCCTLKKTVNRYYL